MIVRARLFPAVAAALALSAVASPAQAARGIHKIKHVVIIMQENRSFDSYFGTFPRADGIPGLAGPRRPLVLSSHPGRRRR